MTDQKREARALPELYGKRMTIEELFRDDKNRNPNQSSVFTIGRIMLERMQVSAAAAVAAVSAATVEAAPNWG